MPEITFCNKRYASLVSELAFGKWVKEGIVGLYLDQQLETAIQDFYNLTHSLHRLKWTMEKVGALNNTHLNESEISLLKEWAEVREDLDERWLVTSLLTKDGKTMKEQLNDLVLLAGDVCDSVVFCKHGNVKCSKKYMRNFFAINHLSCFTYDPKEGHAVIESNVQGIKNGITFIFLTGSKLMASKFRTENLWLIPGFRNTFHVSSGGDGMQMIIHSRNTAPYPELDGIDIAPGMATLIGVTSEENNRLEDPYGDCNTFDIEEDLLTKSLEAKLDYTPTKGDGILESAYSTAQCRSSCLQRYFWEECGCLMMSEKLPFFNSSLLCGHINSEILANPEKYGIDGCFKLENVLNEECKSMLGKLFADLKCVRGVLEMQDNIPEEDEKNFDCNCPVPCTSKEYKTTVSTSRWPSAGPELDAAYQSIVMEIVIPYLQNLNTSLVEGPIQYLSNKTNR